MKVTHRRKLRKISSGVFSSFIDLAIFTIGYVAQGYRGKDPIESIITCFSAVRVGNPNTFKRAIFNAKYKGYLDKKDDYYKITALGKKRLEQILPIYEKKRPWDGKLYLVTYDIPEERKKERDYLRDYLKTLGCGMLQHSVWLTPYNPTGVLIDFIKTKRLTGLVLISDLKEGGFIGGKKAPKIVNKVYNLDGINNEYQKLCFKVDEKKLKDEEIIFEYLSILKKDPQLPFVLLPEDWWGDEAYRVYKKALVSITRNKK